MMDTDGWMHAGVPDPSTFSRAVCLSPLAGPVLLTRFYWWAWRVTTGCQMPDRLRFVGFVTVPVALFRSRPFGQSGPRSTVIGQDYVCVNARGSVLSMQFLKACVLSAAHCHPCECRLSEVDPGLASPIRWLRWHGNLVDCQPILMSSSQTGRESEIWREGGRDGRDGRGEGDTLEQDFEIGAGGVRFLGNSGVRSQGVGRDARDSLRAESE